MASFVLSIHLRKKVFLQGVVTATKNIHQEEQTMFLFIWTHSYTLWTWLKLCISWHIFCVRHKREDDGTWLKCLAGRKGGSGGEWKATLAFYLLFFVGTHHIHMNAQVLFVYHMCPKTLSRIFHNLIFCVWNAKNKKRVTAKMKLRGRRRQERTRTEDQNEVRQSEDDDKIITLCGKIHLFVMLTSLALCTCNINGVRGIGCYVRYFDLSDKE